MNEEHNLMKFEQGIREYVINGHKYNEATVLDLLFKTKALKEDYVTAWDNAVNEFEN
jgi:hypothetical protein